MAETLKIKKKFEEKINEGKFTIKYSVDNLEFNMNKSTLYGNMTIKKKSKTFYINFQNAKETEYYYVEPNAGDDFIEALLAFYGNHILELENDDLDKEGNIKIVRTIKIS